jgi:hypothetical protein
MHVDQLLHLAFEGAIALCAVLAHLRDRPLPRAARKPVWLFRKSGGDR